MVVTLVLLGGGGFYVYLNKNGDKSRLFSNIILKTTENVKTFEKKYLWAEINDRVYKDCALEVFKTPEEKTKFISEMYDKLEKNAEGKLEQGLYTVRFAVQDHEKDISCKMIFYGTKDGNGQIAYRNKEGVINTYFVKELPQTLK